MAATPQFTSTPKLGSAVVSTANTLRDGNGTLVNLIFSGTNGTRVDKFIIKAVGTTTAGMIRFFITVSGVNTIFTEVPVKPIVPSSTIPSFETVVDLPGGLILPSGVTLKVSTEKAEYFTVIALGGDF